MYFNSNSRFDFISFFNADSVFSSVCIIAAAYAGCNKLWVNIWFTLAFGFIGNYYPSLRVNILDLSPNYSGSIMAVINGIASLSGVAAPTIVGMMIPDVSEGKPFNSRFTVVTDQLILIINWSMITVLFSVNAWTMETCVLGFVRSFDG